MDRYVKFYSISTIILDNQIINKSSCKIDINILYINPYSIKKSVQNKIILLMVFEIMYNNRFLIKNIDFHQYYYKTGHFIKYDGLT